MSASSQGATLALLGDPPRFVRPLHVGRPNLGDFDEFQARVRGMWDRDWLTNDGPLVREFEQALASELRTRHCIAVSNATVGLEIAARALGLSGEVIVPAFTFVASAHCLRWQGIRPVFCDVDPRTHQICLDSAERLITSRTSGILAVHLWGSACSVAELEDLARRRRLRLLFDAAHAFGVRVNGGPVGGGGDAEVFSFHATKFVNSFEGGAIATNDDALARELRLMRNFGFAGYDQVVRLGTNGKMTEICAAMGLTSLTRRDEFIARNRANRRAYAEVFGDVPGVSLLEHAPGVVSNDQYVVAEVDADALGLTRDELHAVLQAEQALVRRYFAPGCHRMAPYDAEPESSPAPLPTTERICNRVLQFPTGQAVAGAEIEQIGETLRSAAKRAGEVRRSLANG